MNQCDELTSQELLVADDDQVRRAVDEKLLEGIARGERELTSGRCWTHAQAMQRMERWLN